MQKYGLEEEEWEKVFSVFSRFPQIERAVLFGSRAKGTNKPFSDVDIALEGEGLSLDDLLLLKIEIDDLLLPYEFDFCICKDLKNENLKSHIERRGIKIYEEGQLSGSAAMPVPSSSSGRE